MADWSSQLYWDDVTEADEIPLVTFNLTLARLIVQTGSDRGFGLVHHNDEVARSSGAPDAYASNTFVQGMWERTLGEYIGLAGRIRKIGPIRMRSFNVAGERIEIGGRISGKRVDGQSHLIDLDMWSVSSAGMTTATGSATASLPSRSAVPRNGRASDLRGAGGASAR